MKAYSFTATDGPRLFSDLQEPASGSLECGELYYWESRWRQRQLDGTKTRGIACKKVIASSQYLESRGKSGVKQKNWLRAGPCEPTGRGKMARRNNGHIFARGKPDRDQQNRDDDGEISYVRRSSPRRVLFNKWRDMACPRWCRLHGLSRLPCGPIL